MNSSFKLIAVVSFFLFYTGCTKNGDEKLTEMPKSAEESYSHDHVPDGEPKSISFWWPDRVDLSPLRQHAKESSPYGEKFNYAKEFATLDLDTVTKEIENIMTTSQKWWPADYGNYGPFFIRMAWHSTGTYRTTDGRGGAGGGQQRFEPLNSWPDNANLDKARRLLWPIKKKYGRKLSWADLMVLTGNVAMESMGFKTLGFAGGRTDDWEADLVYWGPETKMLKDRMARYHGKDKKRKLKKPLGAVQMGLIYVNPEGPGANHDPLDSAQDIRETFSRMAMNDEETFALIAGGHTFGKAHGAHKAEDCVGPEPAAAGTEQQGLGWKNKCRNGSGKDTVTSGLEGAWTSAPTRWTHQYLSNLMNNEWKKTESPGGATQWIPKDGKLANAVPDAHVTGKSHAPIMLTSDMALKVDPEYNKIAKRFLEDPKEFEKAFAKAWFKLTHRDMGPRSRYVGKQAPKAEMLWQDNVPDADYQQASSGDLEALKRQILSSGMSPSDLVQTAWAAASSCRDTDMRGGANGGRIRLAPQKDWTVNRPDKLAAVVAKLESIRQEFNKSLGGSKKVSLADTVVLAGNAAVESAAKKAGTKIEISFEPGRTDASQEQTDVAAFGFLEPTADAFRNYYDEEKSRLSPVKMLIDKANLLTLTVPEMTALIGGMRVLGTNFDDSKHGYFTEKVGTLSNDFFVNLLDMSTKWKKSADPKTYEGIDRDSGNVKWTGTPVDLIFGSHSELRALSEVYAADDGQKKLIEDFAKAWAKVMQLDRFEIR